jgi:hypothetical protein
MIGPLYTPHEGAECCDMLVVSGGAPTMLLLSFRKCAPALNVLQCITRACVCVCQWCLADTCRRERCARTLGGGQRRRRRRACAPSLSKTTACAFVFGVCT